MDILSAVFDVFTNISTWITNSLPSLGSLFYSASDGLTFLGVLAVSGLGFSVVFLLINIIRGFLHFR